MTGIALVPETCLAGIGDAGNAISGDSGGNVKASTSAEAALTRLFRLNLELYGDGLDPSKLLFNLEIYATGKLQERTKNTQETMCYIKITPKTMVIITRDYLITR